MTRTPLLPDLHLTHRRTPGWRGPGRSWAVRLIGRPHAVLRSGWVVAVRRLIVDERGSPLIEYTLAGGLIAIVTVGAVAVIGGKVGAVYQAVAGAWP